MCVLTNFFCHFTQQLRHFITLFYFTMCSKFLEKSTILELTLSICLNSYVHFFETKNSIWAPPNSEEGQGTCVHCAVKTIFQNISWFLKPLSRYNPTSVIYTAQYFYIFQCTVLYEKKFFQSKKMVLHMSCNFFHFPGIWPLFILIRIIPANLMLVTKFYQKSGLAWKSTGKFIYLLLGPQLTYEKS